MYVVHGPRYHSFNCFLVWESRTTTHRIGWRLPPCGPKRAASNAAFNTESGTGSGLYSRQVALLSIASINSIVIVSFACARLISYQLYDGDAKRLLTSRSMR